VRVAIAAAGLLLVVSCDRCGTGRSARIEPEDSPATERARSGFASAEEAREDLSAPPTPPEAEAWQTARADALMRGRTALHEIDQRLADLEARIAALEPRSDAPGKQLAVARSARRDAEQRIRTLGEADESTWDEARLQLENAIDTVNEAYALAETALARK
jgi:chromosome segregation ATPase